MQERKGRKKGIIILLLIIIICALVLMWYFKKLTVTIKYNNSLDDTVLDTRLFMLVNNSKINTRLVKDNYTFDGFYETYYLSNEEKEKVKIDEELENTICKDGFKLDTKDYKCISKKQFEIKKNRIIKNTIIEAMWKEKLKTENKNDIDPSTITLSSNKTCIVNKDSVIISAKVENNKSDYIIKWNLPKCYDAEVLSPTKYKLTRKKKSNCNDREEIVVVVTATLQNGNNAEVVFQYEPKISISVSDNGMLIKEKNGVFKVENGIIRTNVASMFFATDSNSIKNASDYEASLYGNINDTITVTTECGQSETVVIKK